MTSLCIIHDLIWDDCIIVVALGHVFASAQTGILKAPLWLFFTEVEEPEK